MQINLSSETIETIKTELESADREISWELARLPAYHTGEETDIYRYWKGRQQTIRIALSEFRVATE